MKTRENKYIATLKRLIWDEQGQDLIEYALMAASIAVAIGATFPSTIAPSISSIFSKVISSFSQANQFGS